jgi:uncharacterized membrane protein
LALQAAPLHALPNLIVKVHEGSGTDRDTITSQKPVAVCKKLSWDNFLQTATSSNGNFWRGVTPVCSGGAVLNFAGWAAISC